MDTYKEDLDAYRAVSRFSPFGSPRAHEHSSTVPPLLIAFILDTRDIPNGQTLTWIRNGSRVTLDVKGKGKSKKSRVGGIMLERWVFKARCVRSSAHWSLLTVAGTVPKTQTIPAQLLPPHKLLIAMAYAISEPSTRSFVSCRAIASHDACACASLVYG